MPPLRHLMRSPLLMLAAPVMVALVAASSVLFARIDGWLQDSVQELVLPTALFDDVLLVTIDDASLVELKPYLGNWPYPRSMYAALLDYLDELQAGTVFFNILYADPRDGDALFGEALSRNPSVVLGAAALRETAEADDVPDFPPGFFWSRSGLLALPAMAWGGFSLPAPVLQDVAGSTNAARLGVLSVEYDPDGVLRRVPLLHRTREHYLPSVVLATLHGSSEPPQLQAGAGGIHIDDTYWPVARDGSVGLVLPPNLDAVPALPFATLIKAMLGEPGAVLDPAWLRGKTIFVGKTALFDDRVNTPRGVISGTHFWALAHGALSNRQFLAPPSVGWNTALLLCGLLPFGLIPLCRESSRSHWGCVLIGTLAAGAIVVGGHVALMFNQQASWVGAPLLVVLVSSLLTVYYLLHHRVRRAVAAEQESEQQRELLGLVSHELKSPLAAIDLTLQNLARLEGVPPEIQARHQRLHRASRRLQSLIDEYLNAERLAGSEVKTGERFDLRVVVGEAVEVAVELSGAANIVTDLTAVPAMMRGDRKFLLTAVSNLIDNAIKYSPSNAPIHIDLVRDGGDWLLSVHDQGAGISDQDQLRIFEPYYRVVGVRQPGTGLGLALVRQIVTAHGGSVGVRSADGLGTSFMIRVPMDGAT